MHPILTISPTATSASNTRPEQSKQLFATQSGTVDEGAFAAFFEEVAKLPEMEPKQYQLPDEQSTQTIVEDAVEDKDPSLLNTTRKIFGINLSSHRERAAIKSGGADCHGFISAWCYKTIQR
mgnify:CR=1 FL=1